MGMEDGPPFESSDSTYVRLTGSALVCKMLERDGQKISKGYNNNVTFCPNVGSKDPDLPSTDPQVSYTWYI